MNDSAPKKLLILPGIGSPENELYSQVYKLITEGAHSYGYTDVKICLYPGQRKTGIDELTLPGAVNAAMVEVDNFQRNGGKFAILARSFGNIVAGKLLQEDPSLNIDRVICYGPSPYPVMWDFFVKNREHSIAVAKEKGTRVAVNFFEGLVPVESLIPSMSCKVVVVAGSDDPYIPPEFIDYLKSLVGPQIDNFDFRVVQGCPHEVSYNQPYNVQIYYLENLFG